MTDAAVEFAKKWLRFAHATTAPVSLYPALDELGDDHELTITVEQFRTFSEAADAVVADSAPSAEMIDRAAMLIWAETRGVRRDIEMRWSRISDDVVVEPFINAAKAIYAR